MKIVTKEEIKNRIKRKFPNQPFEIIEYTRVSKPIKIKCLKCGVETQYSSANNYLNANRKGVCFCYNQNNKKTMHFQNKKRILEIIEEKGYIFKNFGYDESNKKYLISVTCNSCGQVFTKPWTDFIKKNSCPYCENKQRMNTEGLKAILPSEYELLSEYKDCSTPVLVRHECGFIWKTRPKGLVNRTGCPKCNKKISKGEQKIMNFLDKNYVSYQYQVSFPWQSNLKRKYDFYLPEYNCIIEYQGQQHYKEVSIFRQSLSEQKQIDKEKKQEALDNNYNFLEIGFFDFDIIEQILAKIISSTTSHYDVDSSESKWQGSSN